MSKKIRKKMKNSKRRIEARLGKKTGSDQPKPMFSGSNIHYEIADRTQAKQLLICGLSWSVVCVLRSLAVFKAI